MFYILAGADIKEMEGQNFSDVWYNNFLGEWSSVQECKKPIIAAVNKLSKKLIIVPDITCGKDLSATSAW
jgi:hypothetical protein